MLRRRRSARSKPHCRAAASISRSMMLTDSAKPGRACHADRRGVAQHRRDVQLDRGNRIDGALQMHILVGLHRSRSRRPYRRRYWRRWSRAAPGSCPSASSASAASAVMIARLVVGHEPLAARGDPLHRPPDTFRRPQDQRMFGVGEVLRAEPAADIRRDETHRRGRNAQRRGPSRRDCRGCSGWRRAACSGPAHVS